VRKRIGNVPARAMLARPAGVVVDNADVAGEFVSAANLRR